MTVYWRASIARCWLPLLATVVVGNWGEGIKEELGRGGQISREWGFLQVLSSTFYLPFLQGAQGDTYDYPLQQPGDIG